MATLVLLDTRIFAGAADLTGHGNRVELTADLEEKKTTPFGNGGWQTVLGGLFSTSVAAAGQWEASADSASVDPFSWDGLIGRSPAPWTFCPEGATAGELAWFTRALRTSYKLGDVVGEVAPWDAAAAGSAPLLRGRVAHPPGTARTAAGSGTTIELGALTASQRLYAALHLLSVAGTGSPSITVRMESDDSAAFTSPTTRATFSAATAASGRAQFVSAAGPVTDTWWRVAWSVTGTAPSFLFLAALGIA
ncbi:hypothetical protein GCM10010156_52710 [Planobispora rosea]|uniref:Uncharacterized protein n=1 Tax=Planobispora rosea TaxID=35762 RepID=A0A8J3WEV5_PLARO|nr:hypothetical protein [Planobispora rosea]GGS87651.1 hypothetical protein GCM10010156_52710 [Planobispora rosea]GIH86673.1 hypothetical protein Pro02_50810 [Planobispora rosea]